MAQYRDPVTGRFAVDPAMSGASAGAGDAALKAMKNFSESLRGFTKNVGEKIAPIAKNIGDAGIKGARDAGRIVNQRRKEAGLTQENMLDKIESPILKAITGGSFDLMNMMGRGLKGLVRGETGETDPLGDGENGESTEEKMEGRAILEKISDNVEKIAEAATSDGGKAAPEPIKKGGILGMIAGLGGMLGMGKGGGVIGKIFGAIGKVFGKLGTLAKAIPGLVSKAMPFLKQGAKFFKQIFKRLFWPVTALLGIFSFIDGFIAGYEEGGLVEGFKQGIESLFNNLIDVPLNMLKDAVAWIMGALGFENIEKALNSFEFDFGSLFADAFEAVVDFLTDIPDMMLSLFISMVKPIQDGLNKAAKWIPGLGEFSFADDMQAGLDERNAEKKKARAERDRKTEERRARKKETTKAPGVEKAPAASSQDPAAMIAAGASVEEAKFEFMKAQSTPGGSYTDEETGLTFLDYDDYDAAESAFNMEMKSAQIESAGGGKGRYEKGKLVSVDGKPVDARAGAASRIQGAGIDAAAAGSAPVVIPPPPAPSGGGGGGTKPVPVPIPLQIATDPTLAVPAQGVYESDDW